MTATDQRQLIHALLAVEGVADASLEDDDRPEGAGTLRLQLLPGADEVAVAESVNRVLRARFGLAVDAEGVRIEESLGLGSPPARPAGPAPEPPRGPGPEPEPEPAATVEPGPEPVLAADQQPAAAPVPPTVTVGRPGRLSIERVTLVAGGLGITSSVTVGHGEDHYVGTADGAATPTSVNRSVAAATLRAVERAIADRARFEVEHLEVSVAGPDRTVLVVVTMLTPHGSERLSGASVVRDDVRQAVVRASLAAVNRRLEPYWDGAPQPASP